jgi:hypothetical protein
MPNRYSITDVQPVNTRYFCVRPMVVICDISVLFACVTHMQKSLTFSYIFSDTFESLCKKRRMNHFAFSENAYFIPHQLG